jgi:hypothetical protein
MDVSLPHHHLHVPILALGQSDESLYDLSYNEFQTHAEKSINIFAGKEIWCTMRPYITAISQLD